MINKDIVAGILSAKKPDVIAAAVGVEAEGGPTIPKATANRIEAYAVAINGWKAAGKGKVEMERALKTLRGELVRADAQAVTEAYVKGTAVSADSLSDVGDRIALLDYDLDQMSRLVRASQIAYLALREDATDALTVDPTYAKALDAAWASATHYEPKGSDSWAVVQRERESGGQKLTLLALLTLKIEEAAGGRTPQELKNLRKSLKERPDDRPTVTKMRTFERKRLENSPEAKARVAAEARKEAGRVAQKEDARLAAAERSKRLTGDSGQGSDQELATQ